MTDQDPTTKLKALTREHMRLVWQIAQMGGAQLNDDDRRTVQAMAEHSEYAHLWDRLDRLTDAEPTVDGTNPLLHITTHQVIENQIAAGDPPKSARSLTPWWAAAHLGTRQSIAPGWHSWMSSWHVMSERRPYDQARYRELLLALVKPAAACPKQQSKVRLRRDPKRRR